MSCWLRPPVANMPAAFLCPFEDNTTLFWKATVCPRNIQLGETSKPDCSFVRLPDGDGDTGSIAFPAL